MGPLAPLSRLSPLTHKAQSDINNLAPEENHYFAVVFLFFVAVLLPLSLHPIRLEPPVRSSQFVCLFYATRSHFTSHKCDACEVSVPGVRASVLLMAS